MTQESLFVFRIISFNIRYGSANDGINNWEQRANSVGEILQKSAASLILLQEALNFQLDYIQQYLGGWSRLGVGRDDGCGMGEHCAILFHHDEWQWIENGTFWLSEKPSTPGSKSWKSALPRICTWSKMRNIKQNCNICIFNTHLDYESALAREKGAHLIKQYIQNLSSEIPVVVGGDFNESLYGSAIKELCFMDDSPLQPAWSIAHPKTKMPGTFHGFKGNINGPAIDHILVNEPIQIHDSRIDHQQYQNRWPSDHFPIIVELSLK